MFTGLGYDEDAVRMLVTDVLGDMGCTALEAADGPAGLAILESDARIDLLITDVGLPKGMNGRQLANEAQRRRPALKVLYTSGYTENAIVHHGRLDPGVLLLAKPYRKAELARMIRTALDG